MERIFDSVHMVEQIGQTPLQRRQIFRIQLRLGNAAVEFQRPHSGHQHNGVWLQTRQAAFDVQELFRAEVRAEARLRHSVVSQPHSHPGGGDGIAAMGDIGEGAAMDKHGRSLKGLHQIRLQGVLQQRRHGALGLEVMGRDRHTVIGIGHYHPAKARLQVGDIPGKAQHRHDLAGHGDVKAILPGNALHPAAQTVHDIAELAVIHIHAALPDDALDIDPQAVALLNVVIQHGRQQIVGRADGMKIAGKMQIDVLHGDHLRVAAAGRAALDAEYRSEGGLPQGGDGVFPDAPQSIRQADSGSGLTLPRRGGIDGGDKNQLPFRALVLPQKHIIHLGFIAAVALQIALLHSGQRRDLRNWPHPALLRDLNIR